MIGFFVLFRWLIITDIIPTGLYFELAQQLRTTQRPKTKVTAKHPGGCMTVTNSLF
jgi:hypothetical protein